MPWVELVYSNPYIDESNLEQPIQLGESARRAFQMQQGLNHQLVVRLSQTFFVDQTYYFGLLWGEEESSFFQVESLEN